MRRLALIILLAIAVAGCGGSSAGNAPATPTVAPTSAPTTPPATASPAHSTVAPTPKIVASTAYLGFIHTLCRALATKDISTLTGDLPNYQYNSGVRYGLLGDGEGTSGDPSLFNAWLLSAHVRCTQYTPDVAGHGTLLTAGWSLPAAYGLLDLDTYGGVWKINDFTFGGRPALYSAMQTSHPIVPYRGS